MDKIREEFETAAREIYGEEMSFDFSEERGVYVYEKTCNAYAIFQAAKASQWISVADKWPGDETLVMCLDTHGRHLILQLIYTYDYHVEPVWLCENHSDEYDLEDITHWMSLPEGPTE